MPKAEELRTTKAEELRSVTAGQLRNLDVGDIQYISTKHLEELYETKTNQFKNETL